MRLLILFLFIFSFNLYGYTLNRLLEYGAGLEVSRGLMATTTGVCIFGYNGDVDTGSDPEDLTDQGGTYTFATGIGVVTISSSDDGDIDAGNGARTVLIKGLGTAWALTEEVVTLDGSTAVTLAHNFMRINDALVTTVGSSGVNWGNIVVTISSSVTSSGIYIAAQKGKAHPGKYSVPANKTLYLDNWSTGGSAFVRLRSKTSGVSWIVHQEKETDFDHKFLIPIKIPEESDVVLRAQSVSSDSRAISGSFCGYLIDGDE